MELPGRNVEVQAPQNVGPLPLWTVVGIALGKVSQLNTAHPRHLLRFGANHYWKPRRRRRAIVAQTISRRGTDRAVYGPIRRRGITEEAYLDLAHAR